MQQSHTILKGLLGVVLFCFLSCSTAEQPISTPSPISNIDSSFVVPPINTYLLPRDKIKKVSDSLSDTEIAMLQPGDILLRKGFGMVSDFIADYLHEKHRITHCGFVVLRDSSWQVLHTVSSDKYDGMLCEPIVDYCQQSKKGSLIAVRPKITLTQNQSVLQEAERLLQLKIPFDMGFDDRDSSHLYCAEMIRDVYRKVLGQDIVDQRTRKQGLDVLSMSNFLDSSHFCVIFNHFDSTEQSQ